MIRTDPNMFPRLAEEIYRTGYSNTELAHLIDCDPATISYWLSGNGIPHAYYLAKLYRVGCDVIYILTGERTRHDQTGIKNNR